MMWKKMLTLTLASVLLTGLLSGCGGTEEGREAAAEFRSKAEALREEALSEQLLEELGDAPAGEAGFALFFSVCGGEKRARVYSATGRTPDAAWDAAARSAETALKNGGPSPLWVKADLVYVSAVVSAGDLKGIGETFTRRGFRYGLAFDPAYQTALLEAELNTAGIYDYQNGGVDLKRLNDYLEETGRSTLSALPESYTAFQCVGWLCDEEGGVIRLSLDEQSCGRREYAAVDGNLAAVLSLNGAEYLAEQVQEDGSILLPGGGALTFPRHAEALSAMLRGYRLRPAETLAASLDRASSWLLGQIAYTKEGIAFFVDNGEITLEDSALAIIALADLNEAAGSTGYRPVCEALGAGMLSLMDARTGTFAHVLDASDLTRKKGFRSAQWDGMGVTALCRLYEMTDNTLWLTAAQLVLDRMITEESAENGKLWTACAVREVAKHVPDRVDYYTCALQNAQGSLASIRGAEGTRPTVLELLMVSYETCREMTEAGFSGGDFPPELLEMISARAQRQLDGYVFPEFAMYFPEPQKVLGAFMTRENGLRISADELCRNINGYYLYSVNYDRLLEDGMDAGALSDRS